VRKFPLTQFIFYIKVLVHLEKGANYQRIPNGIVHLSQTILPMDSFKICLIFAFWMALSREISSTG